MGKDLKGKELGAGISQRKDGLYTARYTKKNGKRVQKYFKKLQECRAWIAEEQYKNEYCNADALNNMTVGAWFEYWMKEVKELSIRDSTKREYYSKYKNYIESEIGHYLLTDVRPIHCQKILNQAVIKGLGTGSLECIRMILHAMFECAVENQIITQNPMTKSIKGISKHASKNKEALTIEEQKRFLFTLSTNKFGDLYGNIFQFVLQTGLRCGEVIALRWSDIDFENKVIHITKSMKEDPSTSTWTISAPKTKAGIRDIPLTEEAIHILFHQREKNKNIRVLQREFIDLIFINPYGYPTTNSSYDYALSVICKEAKLPQISMHILRHTFATRCIEGGMKPKTLQKILGHSKLRMTMDLYVHITEEESQKEMSSIEKYLKVV